MTTIQIPISLYSEGFLDDEIIVTVEGYMHPEDKASEFSPPSDAWMEITDYRYEFPKSWEVREWRHFSLVMKARLDERKEQLTKMLIEQANLDRETSEIDRIEEAA